MERTALFKSILLFNGPLCRAFLSCTACSLLTYSLSRGLIPLGTRNFPLTPSLRKKQAQTRNQKQEKEREFLKKKLRWPLYRVHRVETCRERKKKYDFLRYRTIVFIAKAGVINLAGKRISVYYARLACVYAGRNMSKAAPCRVTSFSALGAAPNVCIVSKFSHYALVYVQNFINTMRSLS